MKKFLQRFDLIAGPLDNPATPMLTVRLIKPLFVFIGWPMTLSRMRFAYNQSFFSRVSGKITANSSPP
jgi:hypothetical protein